MREKLGIAFALMAGTGLLVVGASRAQADNETTTTTSTSSTVVDEATTTTSTSSTVVDEATTTTSTTTSSTSTTSTTSTSTTSTTTTTVLPLVIDVPLDGPERSQITPERGTQAQVTDTLPPPSTTTTTTTTLPPPDLLPANSGTGRRVVYSKSAMRVWTVESDGSVSATYLVSGRRTWNQPLPGEYSVFSRSSYTCNIKNPNICWRYMVRFTKGPDGDNIGFHEIPTNLETGYKLQSESQLGQALSGGCVRQAPHDAIRMWGWAPIGTKVVVLG